MVRIERRLFVEGGSEDVGGGFDGLGEWAGAGMVRVGVG